MKFKALLFFSCLFFSSLLSASTSNSSVDSLKRELGKKRDNVTRIKQCLELATIYRKTNLDSSFRYADLAYELSLAKGLEIYNADAILSKGVAVFSKGDYNQAFVFFKLSLSLSKSIKYDNGIMKAFKSIGNFFSNVSQYDSALVYYNKGRDICKAIKDEKEEAKLIGSIAQIHSKKGDYAKALEFYNEAIEIASRYKDMEQLGILVNNIGNVFNDKGEYKQALEYYVKSLSIRKELGDLKGVAAVYVNIGNAYYAQQNLREAIEAHYQSLKLNEQIGNKQAVAKTYMTLGRIYQIQQDSNKALSNFKNAEKIILKLGDKSMLSTCYRHLGGLYQSKNNFSVAQKYFEQGLKICEEIGDEKGVGESYNTLGSFYLQQENYAKAESYYRLYLQKSEALQSNKGIAEAYIGIGSALRGQKNYKEAISNCRKGFETVVDNNSSLIRQAACECLYLAYDNTKKYDSAYKYINLFYGYNDSLKNEENSRLLLRRDMEHDFEKKKIADSLATAVKEEQTRAIHAEETRKQKLNFYLILGAFIITLILAIGIFTNFRLKQQSAKIIKKQMEIVEEKNAEIMSSIRYAQRIQNALLTSDEHWDAISQDYFVMLKPKDVVSGDFYWAHYFNDNKAIWVAADCTGHGVPGAFMSMLGIGFLNEIVIEDNIHYPDEILNRLRTKIINALRQKGMQHQQMDGMDLALCLLDKNNSKLYYAGANNPLWIMRNNEIIEVAPDKQPVGFLVNNESEPFTMHEINLVKGDTLYTFTDGYADQFGGDKGKKYKYKRFRDLLKSVGNLPMNKQKESIELAFEEWKGSHEQVDDVCIIGVKYI